MSFYEVIYLYYDLNASGYLAPLVIKLTNLGLAVSFRLFDEFDEERFMNVNYSHKNYVTRILPLTKRFI